MHMPVQWYFKIHQTKPTPIRDRNRGGEVINLTEKLHRLPILMLGRPSIVASKIMVPKVDHLAAGSHPTANLSMTYWLRPALVLNRWAGHLEKSSSGDQMHRRVFHFQASSEGWAVLASLRRLSWHFWRLDRHCVKRFRIRFRCHPLLFFTVFLLSYIFTLFSTAVHILKEALYKFCRWIDWMTFSALLNMTYRLTSCKWSQPGYFDEVKPKC